MKFFKIPSGEITNFPYLSKIGKLKKVDAIYGFLRGQGNYENTNDDDDNKE